MSKNGVIPPHLYAGGELLWKFQQEWKNIHENNLTTSTKAKESSGLISSELIRWWKLYEKHNSLYKQLQMLPQIVEDIENLSTKIGQLQINLDEVTNLVEKSESLSDEYDHCVAMTTKLQELNEFRLLKRMKMESLKVRLASEHANRLTAIQENQPTVLLERQLKLKHALG